MHWASDVTLGAAVGIFSARLVVRSLHQQQGGGLERRLRFETDPDDSAVRLGIQLSVGSRR